MTQRFIAPALLGASLLLSACGGSNQGPQLLPLPQQPQQPAAQPQKNVQFFLGDPQSWKKAVVPDAVASGAVTEGGPDLYVHAPYIVNVASGLARDATAARRAARGRWPAPRPRSGWSRGHRR